MLVMGGFQAKDGGAAVEQRGRRTALVTGGSRGIGRGIALAMAEAGYDLTICHWNDDANAEATAGVARADWGREILVLSGDLADPSTIPAIVNAAWAGMGSIDVLVNNAGINIFERTTELTAEAADRLYAVNFRAPLLLMKETAKRMIEAGIAGNILNITSSRAERAYPGDAVYGGLKAALKRATESAALDLAPHRIRVNCIAPGATAVNDYAEWQRRMSERIPLGRMGQPADIGRIAVWLASDAASYVTGINLRADGGLILPGTPET